jgi:hypothetical protein
MKGLLLGSAISAVALIGCGGSSAYPGAVSKLALSLRSGTVTIEPSGSATVVVDLTRTSYATAVTVRLVGLDAAGITADPLVIDASSNSGTLTLHASATAASGTTTGTVQANGGDGTASIAVTVRAVTVHGSLAIAVTPHAVTVARSGQVTVQIALTRINFPDPVDVTIEGLSQAGVGSTAVQLDSSTSTALVTLLASPTAQLGTTQGTVNANAGAATTPITVTVVAASPFSLDVNPVVTLPPGGTASAVLTVIRPTGFAGVVDVTVAGLPAGVTVDPLSVDNSFSLGLLVFRSDGSGSAVSGAPITVTGTSGTASSSTTLALTLPGLALAVASPALIIGQGHLAGVAVQAASLTSVVGPKTITVAGLPQGVVAAPLQIQFGETVGVLQFTATADAPPGVYALTLTAASGSTTASAGLSLAVETNTVQITAVDPLSITIGAGASQRVVVGIARTGFFRTLPVSVSLAGLPARITAETIVVPEQLSSGVLIVRAAADAALGGPTGVTLTAGIPCDADCPVLASAPLTLTVSAPFDFAFPPSISLAQGAAATQAVTLTRTGGFAGSVVVQVGGVPAGIDAADVVLAPGSTSTSITFTAGARAAAGNSALSINATGAGFTVRRELQLQVFVPAADSPAVASFAPSAPQVFVGERARLTAIFTGDSASIDGIGAVQSGQSIDTPLLARTTTFTLRVRRGTEQVEAQATVSVRYRNRFRELAAAPVGRGIHLAATLPDGSALLMGGHTSDSLNIPSTISTQRFDAAAETTQNGPDLPFFLNTPETSSVQLADGSFLLVGGGINSNSMGLGADAPRATLAFDPSNQQFVRVGNTQDLRTALKVVTPLFDGGALVTGGARGFLPLASSERFDAATRHWSNAASMSVGRLGHTATRLNDGSVLVTGGLICCKITPDFISLVATGIGEVYDPETDQFTPEGSLTAARSFHTATLLPDGRVLIAGGLFGDDANPSPADAEIYDPSSGKFTAAGALQVPRGNHSAVLLTDGRVLVVGGTDAAHPFVGLQTTEIYDPATNEWTLGPVLRPAWTESTVTVLGNGKVLIFGGETPQGDPVSTVMLFE